MASGTVFFIGAVGAKDSPERARTDEVYKFILKPVVEEGRDMTLVRADLIKTPGQVTAQIIQNIVQCDVLIADVTGRNANVYYELGVAHSFRKPVVILADHASSLTFDTHNERIIEIGDDGAAISAQAVDDAKARLTQVLDVVLAEGYVPENLVTNAATAQSFEQLASSDPRSAELHQIREQVAELRQLVLALANRVGTPGWASSEDWAKLREGIEWLSQNGHLPDDFGATLIGDHTSREFDNWARNLDNVWNQIASAPVARDDYGPDEAPF